MSNNPWLVDCAQAFSFLNCPECTFKTKKENTFEYHAVKNHPLSSVLFDISKYFSDVEEITIDEQKFDPLGVALPEKEKNLEEFIKTSTSGKQKRKGSNDQLSTKLKKTKLQPEPRKDLKCDFCNFSTFERSDLVFHVQKEHLSIDSDDDENHNIQCVFCDFTATEKSQMDEHVKAKHVLSSNVKEEISEITIDEHKIDPLGASPVKEKTLEELMFQEPELQVNLCQKLFFLQNMGRTCCVPKLF